MPHRTIFLKGYPQRREAVAAGTIKPGHLLQLNSTGRVQVHSNAAKTARPVSFAYEYELRGLGIDDNYVVNDIVLYGISRAGDEVYALLAAGASAVVVGDFLESAGDGTLRKVATDTSTSQDERESLVAQAIEAVDNSGGGTVARIQVRIL